MLKKLIILFALSWGLTAQTTVVDFSQATGLLVPPKTASALGTDATGALISVSPGGGTTPGYPANQPVSGCGVEYVSGLIFSVGACTYTIGGVQYSSAITTVTLAAADPTNPRIDVIYVDNTGTANKLTGTPAASPAQPTVDYSTQLPLNLVLVAANGATPSGIAITSIYEENTEWTSTCSTNINCASTSNPFRGTKDIEATAAVLGNTVTLVKPAAGTTDLSTQNTLIFYIRSKAAWPSANNTGANGLRTLSLFWLSGSTQVGVQVVLKDGAFGFSSSSTSAYQQIAIPISNFGTGSTTVTTLKAQVTGNGGTSSFGWYIDGVSLQSGQAPLSLPTTLMNFKGTWSSTANYNVNDTVTLNGLGYVALAANTNVAVSVAATWAPLAKLFATNAQTSTYQVLAADFAACKTIPVASGTFTITLVASASQPQSGQCVNVFNYGSGVVTIARSGQNINGGTASLTLNAGSATAPSSAFIVSDATNYFADVVNPVVTTTCTAPQFLIATATCTTPVLTQNSQSAAYTTVLGDAGKMILHPSSDNNARTFTIDSNANVAYPTGTCITFVNMINTVTIAITTDTMTLMGSNTTGSRTLAVGNWATACKIASTAWVIGGSLGLT